MKNFILLFLFLGFCSNCKNKDNSFTEWKTYLGDPGRSHFSKLDQINKDNLDRLEIAWEYSCPDSGQMQMNPIIVDGKVFGVTAGLRAFALDAETGEEIWLYGDDEKVWHSTSRGVSYWEKGKDERIFYTVGKDLIALNAQTGKPIETFGNAGKVDLHKGLIESAKEKFIISNTPGTIYKDLIIMPVRVSEDENAAPGDIRAFNVKNGALAWSFHVIPYPNEKGFDDWENKKAYLNTEGIGAGNNWAGMTLDSESGILYVPTGSIAPDFYGANRKGKNLFANCLLALDASTGDLIWHQQIVHHDIWDRDLPAPPNLLYIRRNGKRIKVVAQATKHGYLFLYHAKTGEPIFDIVEKKVPSSNLPNELAWETQPFPSAPPPFSRRSDELDTSDISPYAPNREELKAIFEASNRDFFAPPDTNPVLLLPGYDGGAEWGGAGVDPDKGILYLNANEMAWFLEMEETADYQDFEQDKGHIFYKKYCQVCHQADLEGIPESGYPSLKEIGRRYSDEQIAFLIKNGKGMMPGNPIIQDEEINLLIDFLKGKANYSADKKEVILNGPKQLASTYTHKGYKKFLDENGLPAICPPWGTLSAVDLNTGNFLWKRTLGQVDSLIELGYPETGTENYGGPIVTGNGLIIIAATKDEKLRIFDRENGNLLWEDNLPASSFATPSTYQIKGKQFIVLACGGEKLGTKSGNKIIAYSLKN